MKNLSYKHFILGETGLGLNRSALICTLILLLLSLDSRLMFFGLLDTKLSLTNSIFLIFFSFIPSVIAYSYSVMFAILKIKNDAVLSNYDSDFQKKISNLTVQINRIESRFLTEKLNYTQNLAPLQKLQKEHPADDINKAYGPFNTSTVRNLDFEYENNDLLPSWPILIRALHFPIDTNDTIGFKALKLAHRHNDTSNLLTASEDLMMLLSQNGIYLDDHNLRPLTKDGWINFTLYNTNTEKRNLKCAGHTDFLKTLQTRINLDTIFRDANLTLLRRFDKMLKNRISTASPDEIHDLSYTRTCKAFILAGKASKTF